MRPIEALDRIAELLMRSGAPGFKVKAFRQAAGTVSQLSDDDLRALADAGRLADLPGIGSSTATVIEEALAGKTPAYLENLIGSVPQPGTEAGNALRARLRGDLHMHSTWSDGGASIREMADKAMEIGHDYIALTDHSSRLTVANGLDRARLEAQIDEVRALNEELAPFRVLTGVEVDINEDGSLDQDPDLLMEIDLVVASVHSKLRMPSEPMTHRMLAAVANPRVDVLGHCTGRMLSPPVARPRPESEFDSELVIEACRVFDKAVEINCRPERLDPPRRILRAVVDAGVKISIDTDAHSISQLEWHPFGCDRAVECDVVPESVVNTWKLDELLEWTGSHRAGVIKE